MQPHFHPEIMFAQVIPVIRSEDHHGTIVQPLLLQRPEDFTQLCIHIRYRGIIGCNRFLLLLFTHHPVLAGHIVDTRLRDIIPVVHHFGRQHHLFIGIRRKVLLRCHKRDMRPEKTCGNKKGLIFMHTQQLRNLVRRLPVRIIRITPFRTDNGHQVLSLFRRLETIGVFLHQFPLPFGMPQRILTVKPFVPGILIVRTIGPIDHVLRTHVKDFADTCCIVPVVFKQLRPRLFIRTNIFPTTYITVCTRGRRVVTKHQGSPRGTAYRIL